MADLAQRPLVGLPKRVLLVEDNEMNRDMLTRRLQRRGFQVYVATDGRTALSEAERLRPDVVLLDMSLPEIDGWEVARRMKSQAAVRGTPVIALTAHAMAGDREKCLAAGCDEFEAKPVDLTSLLGKMQRLMGESNG